MLIIEYLLELDTPLSLSCIAKNLRMAALHFEKSRNLHEHSALAFESNKNIDLISYKQYANKHQVHAQEYSLIAEAMIEKYKYEFIITHGGFIGGVYVKR